MTTDLAPAKLTRLKQVAAKGKKGKPSYEAEKKGSFEVQFNPTSLKITRSNNLDKGGATTGTQKRQTPSVQPATLSFDLEFDTAEGDAQGQPLDVRELTHVVRQFTEPTKENPDAPPPAVRFEWGSFRFQGIVTQLTEDLDYFSPTGRPLRAKLSLTITEQNPEWEAGAIGPGARNARAARPPGAARGTPTTGPGGATAPAGVGGTGPGAGPTPDPVTTALAQAGESVQQLMARLDEDPATWRTAMAGLQSPLSLAAGAQVRLGASASASAGLGTGAGFTASPGVGATASVRAALGGAGTAGSAGGLTGGATAEATPSPPARGKAHVVRPLTTNLDQLELRPYFLWDEDVSIAELRQVLALGPEAERLRLLAKMLREARDTDVWRFVTPEDVALVLPQLERRLGRRNAFWRFLIEGWKSDGLLAG